MSTTTESAPWFTPQRVGFGFVGDRTRLHVSVITAVEPDALRLETLCDSSEPTTAKNPSLDIADEQACRTWWESKVKVEPGATIDKSIRGGLAKPRVCGTCRELHEGRQ